MAQSSPSSPAASWMVRIFPWIFVLVGTVILVAGLRNVWYGWQSARWPATQGEITSSAVKYHSSNKGRGSYSAEIRYQFRVEPSTYTGDRVAFGGVSGKHAGAQTIVNRYPQGKPVEIHYHPTDPGLCVLEPGLHAFAFALPGAGLVFAGFGLFFAWAMSGFGGRKTLPPGVNPWDHKRWCDGIARTHQAIPILFLFFFGSIFVAAAIGIPAGETRETLMRTKPAFIILAAFLLAGLGILAYAFINLFRWRRFRRCFVQMRTVPGVIGGTFAGFLNLPDSLPDDANITLELLCEARQAVKSGRNKTTFSTVVVWSEQTTVPPAARQHGLQGGVPFEFAIPAGLHDETDEDRTESTTSTYQWYLRATASIPGADLDLKFHVPVFRIQEEPQRPALSIDMEGSR